MLKSLFPWKHNKTKQTVPAQPPMDEELILQEGKLLPCHVCGRTFLPIPLKKHNKICEKNAIKKRKPFNSLKQRVAGTDLADFHQDNYIKKKEEPVVEKQPRQSKWKEKHLELMTVIRAAKGVSPSEKMPTSISPKPRSTTSLLNNTTPTEQCPSCERYFGPKAFDRHTEWCKEKKARIQPSPSNIQQAKERLEARIKYRVPPLTKSKRAIVREKYSPGSTNVNNIDSFLKSCDSATNFSSSLSRDPSIRKPKSLHSLDKYTSEPKHKVQRADISKCSGDKIQEFKDHVPNIGNPSPKAESKSNFPMKKAHFCNKRINDISVNQQTEGITVSSINCVENTKSLVTWKDTVVKPISKNNINKLLTEEIKFKKLKKNLRQKKNVEREQQVEEKCYNLMESKTEHSFLCTNLQHSKQSVEKMLSSDDVIHKNFISKIPAKIGSKTQLIKNLRTINQKNDTITNDSNTNKDLLYNGLTVDHKELELIPTNDTESEELISNFDKSISNNTCVNLDEWFEKEFSETPIDIDVNSNGIQTVEAKHKTESSICKHSSTQENNLQQIVIDSLNTEMLMTISNNGDAAECAAFNNDLTNDNKVPSCAQCVALDKDKEHLVCLFSSVTDLNLTRDTSLNTSTDQISFSSFTSTNKYTISENRTSQSINQNTDCTDKSQSNSTMSIRKSFSDTCLLRMENNKETISIFLNNGQHVFESDSVDFRKTCQDLRSISSAPAIHYSVYIHSRKKIKNHLGEKLSEISEAHPNQTFSACNKNVNKELFICFKNAARKFLEDGKHSASKEVLNLDVTASEDYTVPKKKRRIDVKIDTFFNYTIAEQVGVAKKLSLPKNISSGQPILGSSKSSLGSATSTVTPRTLSLVEKITKAKELTWKHGDVLLAVSVFDCGKLLDMNKTVFEKVEKKVRKKMNKINDRINLPLIIGGIEKEGNSVNETGRKFRTNESYIKLPDINNKKEKRKEMEKVLMNNAEMVADLSNTLSLSSSNYDPFALAQRQFMELLECDDFKPTSPLLNSSTADADAFRPHTTPVSVTASSTSCIPHLAKKTIKSAENKKNNRKSIIDPPLNFKDSLELFNNDFELIENMFNENLKSDENNGGFYIHNIKSNTESFSLDQIFANRKYSDDMSTSIDPCLINENDNLSIPENLKIDNYSPTSTIDTETTLNNDNIDIYSTKCVEKMESNDTAKVNIDKKPLVKRSLSLVDRNKLKTSKIQNTNINNNKKSLVSKNIPSKLQKSNNNSISSSRKLTEKTEKKKTLPVLKRSMTLFNPSPKPSFKNKKDVNDYFNNGKVMSTSLTNDLTIDMKDDEVITEDKIEPSINVNGNLKAEDLFTVDDEMYEEYKKYEEMYLKEKKQQCTTNKISNRKKNVNTNYGLLTSNEGTELTRGLGNNLPNDSAYGSLRKPANQKRNIPKIEMKNIESTSSSSGSENGASSPAALSKSIPKVSKFCHECGTKFPVLAAKFCVECGVKRLVL